MLLTLMRLCEGGCVRGVVLGGANGELELSPPFEETLDGIRRGTPVDVGAGAIFFPRRAPVVGVVGPIFRIIIFAGPLGANLVLS